MGSERTYSPSEIRTVALAVIAGVLFGGIATGVAFPTLPLLDEHLVISAAMLGIILSANRISRLVMNTPAGTLIDRMGPRKPMIIGLFIQAFAPFGYIVGLHTPGVVVGWAPFVGDVSAPGLVFVFARLFWGFGSAFVFIGAFTIINHVTTTSNRGRWIGYMRGGQSLGFPSGLILGGFLTDLASMEIAFLVAGSLALIAGIVATLVLPDVAPDAETRAAKLSEIPTIVQERPAVVLIGFGNFTLRFLWGGVILATLARYAEFHEMQLTLLEAAGISGLVMAVGVLVSGGTTVVTGRVSDTLDNRSFLTVPAFVLLATGFLVAAYVPTIGGLFAAVMLMGLGMGAAGPILLAVLGDLTPGPDLGRVGGVYNTFGDIGLSLGPLVALPAVDFWFGFRVTYILCAVLVLSCLVVVSAPLIRDPDRWSIGVTAD